MINNINNNKHRYLYIRIFLLFIISVILSCSVVTNTISLENEVYLDNINGQYYLTTEGAAYCNDSNMFFSTTPSPAFETNIGFLVPGSGTVNINNINNSYNILLAFQNTVPGNVNSGIFKIISPIVSESSNITKNNRYLKIDVNTTKKTLIISDQFSETEAQARLLVANITIAIHI